jgi:hypothetical protein
MIQFLFFMIIIIVNKKFALSSLQYAWTVGSAMGIAIHSTIAWNVVLMVATAAMILAQITLAQHATQ